MALVNLRDMLDHAYRNGYAVGAFDMISLEFLESILAAAEHCHSPVILSLAESHFEHFDFDLIMPAVEAAAHRSPVPVAIHLDHGTSLDSAIHAINKGCNGVMIDASHGPLSENIHSTRAVVDVAHACGIPVEGELGYVPGVEGEDAMRHPGEIAYTRVEDAKTYVEKTGIDFLAVSIGTVHGRMTGKPDLDYQRLQQINESLEIPLVIHGGTGLSDDQFHQLIRNGVAKINYYTALADAADIQILRASKANKVGIAELMQDIRHAIREEVEHCMQVWGSVDRASELLACCTPWIPVEHLIVYNTKDISRHDTKIMMTEGRQILSKIPGVREVVTGEALQKDAKYRYVWLVRFCHPMVVDSYREHPAHVAFANTRFRPVAGQRISIDFLPTT